MNFFNDLSRQLLRNSNVADIRSKASGGLDMGDEESAEQFYDLVVKRYSTNMAYHEYKRATHLMYKSTFESFT